MVSNGENIFQKTQKYRKHVEKAQGIGKNWACTSSPQSTSWHPARLRPVYPILCFRAFHESVLTLFFNQKKKKKVVQIKFLKICMFCQTGAFRYALSICLKKKKKKTCITGFKNRGKRKLIKSGFSKIRHLSLN